MNGSAMRARATRSTSVSPKLYSKRPATRNAAIAAIEPRTSARASSSPAGIRESVPADAAAPQDERASRGPEGEAEPGAAHIGEPEREHSQEPERHHPGARPARARHAGQRGHEYQREDAGEGHVDREEAARPRTFPEKQPPEAGLGGAARRTETDLQDGEERDDRDRDEEAGQEALGCPPLR